MERDEAIHIALRQSSGEATLEEVSALTDCLARSEVIRAEVEALLRVERMAHEALPAPALPAHIRARMLAEVMKTRNRKRLIHLLTPVMSVAATLLIAVTLVLVQQHKDVVSGAGVDVNDGKGVIAYAHEYGDEVIFGDDSDMLTLIDAGLDVVASEDMLRRIPQNAALDAEILAPVTNALDGLGEWLDVSLTNDSFEA